MEKFIYNEYMMLPRILWVKKNLSGSGLKNCFREYVFNGDAHNILNKRGSTGHLAGTFNFFTALSRRLSEWFVPPAPGFVSGIQDKMDRDVFFR